MIFLGAGFNERTSYLWDTRLLAGKKVVQIDSDASQLEKVFQADVAIHGDIRAVLEDLLALLGTGNTVPSGPPSESAPVPPHFAVIAHFYARLAERLPQDAQIFDDNIIFAQSYLKASPQTTTFRIPAFRRSATRFPPPSVRAAPSPRPLSPSSATAASRCAAWR